MRKRNTDRGEEQDLKAVSLLFYLEKKKKKKDKEDFCFGVFFPPSVLPLQAVE